MSTQPYSVVPSANPHCKDAEYAGTMNGAISSEERMIANNPQLPVLGPMGSPIYATTTICKTADSVTLKLDGVAIAPFAVGELLS